MTQRRAKAPPKSELLPPQAPLLEWIMAACGLAAAVGAIGYLVWEGLHPHQGPPHLAAAVQEVVDTPTGYIVAIRVTNQSRVTASAVEVEGVLEGRDPPESSSLTFDYVPGNGRREGSMTFQGDPSRGRLSLSVKGQITP